MARQLTDDDEETRADIRHVFGDDVFDANERLNRPALRAMAPFNETFRELLEMRYLWDQPVLLDNSRLVARLGAEPRTDLTVALRSTLQGMGLLAAGSVANQALVASQH